jgi:hypothetical protein
MTNRLKVIASDYNHGASQLSKGNAASGAAWIQEATVGLAGVMTSVLGWKAARAYQNQRLSIDPEMEGAVQRRLLAPWARYNDFIIREYDPKSGELSIQDVGYSNPFGEITAAMEAVIFQPGTIGEKAGRLAHHLEEALLGKEIFLWAGLETAMNVKTEGSSAIAAIADSSGKAPVAHEYQPEALMERMYYFFKKAGPGIFVEPERVFEAAGAGRFYGLLPEKDKAIDYTVWQEVLAIFGMPRVAGYNISESLGYHYKDLGFRRRAMAYAIGRELKQDLSPKDVEHFSEAWQEVQSQLHELVDDSWKLKRSNTEIRRMLKDAGFNDRVAKAAMRGQFVSLDKAFTMER